MKKMLVTAQINDAIDRMNNHVKTLKHHIYIKRMHVKCCNGIKEDLDENEILMHVDYSENYENKQQCEKPKCVFWASNI